MGVNCSRLYNNTANDLIVFFFFMINIIVIETGNLIRIIFWIPYFWLIFLSKHPIQISCFTIQIGCWTIIVNRMLTIWLRLLIDLWIQGGTNIVKCWSLGKTYFMGNFFTKAILWYYWKFNEHYWYYSICEG